jgi:SAM-dependent methyltransferase
MRQRDQNVYASVPVRRLQADQMRVITPQLQRCAGDYALMIDPSADDTPPPALPMLGCWIRMQVEASRYHGDLKAAADESMPFVDDAFELVLLRCALEAAALPRIMLGEVIRVLAPGGVLAITGVHPISVWAAWLRWRARGNVPSLSMPLRLMLDLREEGFEIEQSQRTGCVLPSSTTPQGMSSKMFGGGYVIVARKRRRAVTPLRIQPDRLQVPASGRLSPSTRRNAAL